MSSREKLPPIENAENVKQKPNPFGYPVNAGSVNNFNESDYSGKNSPEKPKKRFKSFKQVANLMGMNYKWTKETSDAVQGDHESRNFATGTDNEQPLTFNVSGEYSIMLYKLSRYF